MGIPIWCLIAPMFLVSVKAGLHDIVAQSFYEEPKSSSPAPTPTQSPRPELIGMNEFVIFLTPEQVETLQSAGAVVQPYPDYENDFNELQEQFRQSIEQQNVQEYQTWLNPVEDQKKSSEVQNYYKLLNIQEINDNLSQEKQTTEGTTEKATTTPRHKYTKAPQQYKEKEYSTPYVPKKASRTKISNQSNNADYVRFLPNYEQEVLQKIPYQALPISPYRFEEIQANANFQANEQAQRNAYSQVAAQQAVLNVANAMAQQTVFNVANIEAQQNAYSKENSKAQQFEFTHVNTEAYRNTISQPNKVAPQNTFFQAQATTEGQKNAISKENTEAHRNGHFRGNAHQNEFTQVNTKAQINANSHVHTDGQQNKYSQGDAVAKQNSLSPEIVEAQRNVYSQKTTEGQRSAYTQENAVKQQNVFTEVNNETHRNVFSQEITESQKDKDAYFKAKTKAQQTAFPQANSELQNEYSQQNTPAKQNANSQANTVAQASRNPFSQANAVTQRNSFSQTYTGAEKTANTVVNSEAQLNTFAQVNTEAQRNAYSQENKQVYQNKNYQTNPLVQETAKTVAIAEAQLNVYAPAKKVSIQTANSVANTEAQQNAYTEASTKGQQNSYYQTHKENQRNLFKPTRPSRVQLPKGSNKTKGLEKAPVPVVTPKPTGKTYVISQGTTEFTETLSSIEGLPPLLPLHPITSLEEQQEMPVTPAKSAPTVQYPILQQDRLSLLLAPLYQHQTITDTITRQKEDLLRNEFNIRTKLQKIKESPQYYDQREYTAELEKLMRNFGRQNALARIEASTVANTPTVFENQSAVTTESHPVQLVKSTEVPMLVRISKPHEVKIPGPYPVPLEIMQLFRVPKPVIAGKLPVEGVRNVFVKVDEPYTIPKFAPFTEKQIIPVMTPVNPDQLKIIRHIWEH